MTAHAPIILPPGVSVAYLQHHRVCPCLGPDGSVVQLLVAPDALIEDSVGELTDAFNVPLEQVPVAWATVQEALASLGAPPISRTSIDESTADLRNLADQPPVIRFLNGMIQSAVSSRASDVHLEITRDTSVARLRIDGILTPTLAPPPEMRDAVVSRIKLLANMDIADRRTPQDGSFRVRLDHAMLDIRVSTVPTAQGESVVLRLLAAMDRPSSVSALGLTSDMRQVIDAALHRSNGLVLVTGPTGSGKTTTLYAALQSRSAATEKIMTVEDPIEYALPGVTQVAVASRTNVSFADALRSLLRQDPDVIMIGEIRDEETASIAVRAALTGHLVLSTLHTNEAASGLTRLMDLGIPAYLLKSTLRCIIAQRLVRRICPSCSAPYSPTDEERRIIESASLPVTSMQAGTGCDACRGTGFSGRLAIFEVLECQESMVLQHSHSSSTGEQGRRQPKQMWNHGLFHVSQGSTTLAEVLRVAQQ